MNPLNGSGEIEIPRKFYFAPYPKVGDQSAQTFFSLKDIQKWPQKTDRQFFEGLL